MTRTIKTLAQLALYLPLMALIAYFSSAPKYTVLPAGEALVRLSFIHAAERKQPCRERSPAELARLAPNMRAALECPRERAPLLVELELDGQVVVRREVLPAGLQRDGNATVYHRLPVPAGRHRIVARLRDRAEGEFNYVREATLDLAPGSALLVDFNPAQGGFVFHG